MSSPVSMLLAERVVRKLLGIGVREAVVSPGSRSGPLALAFHAAERAGLLRLHVRIDEREAAFLALGLAKATGRRVPVLTTSGTAVANLHPAVLEAWHERVGVIALTSDRPAELRGTGANQTTDQRGLLAPVPTLESLDDVDWDVAGPVHLNLRFAEPLLGPHEWSFGQPGDRAVVAPPTTPTVLEPGLRTVVVAGDGAPSEFAEVAERAGWPVLAEPSSGLRGSSAAVATGRLLLGHERVADRIERVVSLGHTTLSRPTNALLSRTDVPIVHVGDQSTFPVPAGENVTFVESVEMAAGGPGWLHEWLEADRKLTGALGGHGAFDVARAVWTHAAANGSLLVLGPSQPARDVDLVAPVGEPAPRVLANRGLAGIDGVVSTAVGATLGHGGSGVLLLGDVTFLHGSNGLLLGPEEPRPDLTVVVLNDNGGSIFTTLEQGAEEFTEPFERVFGTPTGVRIDQLCAAFGVPHEETTAAGLPAVLNRRSPGLRVLEIKLPRDDRRAQSLELRELAARVLD